MSSLPRLPPARHQAKPPPMPATANALDQRVHELMHNNAARQRAKARIAHKLELERQLAAQQELRKQRRQLRRMERYQKHLHDVITITRLQAIYRGHAVRKKRAREQFEKHLAAVHRIETWFDARLRVREAQKYRVWLTRQRVMQNLQKKVGKCWKQHKLRQEAKGVFDKMRKLQEDRLARQHERIQLQAATRVQALFRGQKARRQVAKWRKEQRSIDQVAMARKRLNPQVAQRGSTRALTDNRRRFVQDAGKPGATPDAHKPQPSAHECRHEYAHKRFRLVELDPEEEFDYE